MSYTPGGEPAEVLRLALQLAETARQIDIKFQEDVDRGDQSELWQLGPGVEAIRPLWEIIEDLNEIVRDARSRYMDWNDMRA